MRIGHVHLKVRNLDRAVAFYSALLGAKVTERLGQHYAFLTMGEAHHELALQALGDDAKSPPPHAVGLYHSAFEVASQGELAAAIERLKALGSRCDLVDHGISWALYTADPDGNGVEIYLDRRQAAGGAKSWNGQSYALDLETIKTGA
ncbi:MAG: biphenyl-2,3-diol 1,2-dioxygenase [Proteobacteria bacterium]|nr:biphenyl-2,3-diol 1,2-dioxygenase [Pseudomonadota bacterium]